MLAHRQPSPAGHDMHVRIAARTAGCVLIAALLTPQNAYTSGSLAHNTHLADSLLSATTHELQQLVDCLNCISRSAGGLSSIEGSEGKYVPYEAELQADGSLKYWLLEVTDQGEDHRARRRDSRASSYSDDPSRFYGDAWETPARCREECGPGLFPIPVGGGLASRQARMRIALALRRSVAEVPPDVYLGKATILPCGGETATRDPNCMAVHLSFRSPTVAGTGTFRTGEGFELDDLISNESSRDELDAFYATLRRELSQLEQSDPDPVASQKDALSDPTHDPATAPGPVRLEGPRPIYLEDDELGSPSATWESGPDGGSDSAYRC